MEADDFILWRSGVEGAGHRQRMPGSALHFLSDSNLGGCCVSRPNSKCSINFVMALATCVADILEKRRPLAVDAMIPDPIFTSTHAITIDAPPEAVWPWIAQMGAGRAGWYSWDVIDNGGTAKCEAHDARTADRGPRRHHAGGSRQPPMPSSSPRSIRLAISC